ncbi:MAG: hypothetical protein ACPKPY_08000 [Nitrososphaeraceae archaeon]
MQLNDYPTIQIQTMVTEYEAHKIETIINYMQSKNMVTETGNPKITRRSFTRQALLMFIDKWMEIIENNS